jgi:hypothetical protein
MPRAERLDRAVPAWNVDGSSGDCLAWGSWIKFWETHARQKRGKCAYADCSRRAEVGGHVWMKMRGLCIAPICHSCNSCRNPDRMQHADGQHSRLRSGTVVVRIWPTAEILGAARRVAIRVCATCRCDISARPRSHTLCYPCWKKA